MSSVEYPACEECGQPVPKGDRYHYLTKRSDLSTKLICRECTVEYPDDRVYRPDDQ